MNKIMLEGGKVWPHFFAAVASWRATIQLTEMTLQWLQTTVVTAFIYFS